MFVLPLHKLWKQWKLYKWLNIVNIFKKDWIFIWKTQKLSIQPNIINKNAEALLDKESKEIGLEVNSEKTKLNRKFLRFQMKSQSFLIYLQYLISYIISIAFIIYVMARQTSKCLKQMTV
jgi:hypothetical protein